MFNICYVSLLLIYYVYDEDFQRWYGLQAFVLAVKAKEINSTLDPQQFVEVFDSSCSGGDCAYLLQKGLKD